MKPTTMNEIIKVVEYAREKHPQFAATAWETVSLATEELGEFAKAVNDGNYEQARQEAMDTIAVLVRFLESDL